MDIYINGSLVKSGEDDYCTEWPVGTTYEIKNIQPAEGYVYNGPYSGSISGTVGNAEVKIALSFSKKTYTLTYDANGGTGAPDPVTKTHGETAYFPNGRPTRTGYTFLGWSEDRNATEPNLWPGGYWNGEGNRTFYAVWRPNRLTMRFHANGGSISSSRFSVNSDGYVLDGSEIDLSYMDYGTTVETGLYNAATFGLTKAGYVFVGWCRSADGSTTIFDEDDASLTPETIYPELKNGDATVVLYAVWQANKYYLDVNGRVDGEWVKTLEDVACLDIYVNGELVGNAISDYCTQWPTGTTYEIKNIQGFGYDWTGVSEGTISGTIGDSSVSIVFDFAKIPSSSEPAATLVYDGRKYERYDYNTSWTEAKALCESKGGHLVTITDDTEHAKVLELLSGCPFGVYYIGATDTSGTWEWVTGEAFSYEKWDADAPEPTNGEGEDYAAVIGIDYPKGHPWKQIGEWIDTHDASITGFYAVGNTGFICEYDTVEYSVSYNANGGSGAPDSQTKTHDTTLTLSSTKPTRSNASAGSYTVTFSANGGTVNSSSLTAERTTSYTFKNWNTEADSSGTDYAAGAGYTANADVTLYAQWDSNTTTAAVTLPTPTREGHTFLGWAESANATGGMTGEYTPTGDVTLYAIWQADVQSDFKLILSNAEGRRGETVKVSLRLEQNPGIRGLSALLEYDHTKLQLLSAEAKTAVGTFESSSIVNDGLVFWYSLNDTLTADGEMLEFSLKILDDAEFGDTGISLSFGEWDGINDSTGEQISDYQVVSAVVTITTRKPGDITGDGKVNLSDVLRLADYVKARGIGVEIVPNSGDVTGDGKVNLSDVLRLADYVKARGIGVEIH